MKRITFEPYVSLHAGWAEQDPEVYWNALKQACNLLKEEHAGYFSRIAGVGITTMRDSMVCIDKEGNTLRPLMVWLDQRKAKPVYKPGIGMKLVIWVIGIGDSIKKAQRDGKCNWIKQNQLQIWLRTHKYLQVSGFLNYRLTGEFKDSVASQIGHIPFDYKRQKWGNPRNLLTFSAKLYPVEKEKLPELVLPGKVLGTVTKIASGETGDEVDGVVGQEVGQILIGRMLGRRSRIEVEMFARGLDGFVETTFGGEVLGIGAEVPFAEHAGGVAGFLERLGQRDFIERQFGDIVDWSQRAGLPIEAVDAADGVDAGARAVLAAHETRAGRLAIGAAGVAARESCALGGESVDVRRFVILAAEAGDVGVAEVVGEDEDDVGFFSFRGIS